MRRGRSIHLVRWRPAAPPPSVRTEERRLAGFRGEKKAETHVDMREIFDFLVEAGEVSPAAAEGWKGSVENPFTAIERREIEALIEYTIAEQKMMRHGRLREARSRAWERAVKEWERSKL